MLEELCAVGPKVQSTPVHRIRLRTHQALPQDAIEALGINAVFYGEIHPFCGCCPVRRIVGWEYAGRFAGAGAEAGYYKACQKARPCNSMFSGARQTHLPSAVETLRNNCRSYSVRSASAGDIRLARNAGMKDATRAENPSVRTATKVTIGS